MQWTVGKVTVTKVVELEMAGGSRFLLPQATPEAVREIDWLAPHFADAGRQAAAEHPCADHRDAGAAHPGGYLPRQRQAGPPHPALERPAGEIPGRPGGGGLPRREHRHRALHPSACRSCRLEHAAAGRALGADLPAGALHLRRRRNSPTGRAPDAGEEVAARGLRRHRAAHPRCRPRRAGRGRPPAVRGGTAGAELRPYAGPCQRPHRLGAARRR